MPRFTTFLRYRLARALVKSRGFSIVPSWITQTVLDPTFLSLTRDGYKKSSAFFACVSALAFAFPEPPVAVYDGDDDDAEPLPQHPLRALVRQPFSYPGPNGRNVSMMGEDMLMAVTMVYMAVGGVCYWHKLRGKAGQVVGLRPYHAGQILPVPGGPTWVSHYLYDMLGTAGIGTDTGNLPQIAPWDMIPLKWPTVDPAQPWTTLPPIVAAAAEVDTDVEANRFAYAVLKNDAVPRTVITVPADRPLDDEEYRRTKEQWKERYGGDNRGDVAILEGGSKVERLGLNMQELAFDALAKLPERRICAAMRTPPVVAGLGDDPTYSNAESAYQRWTRSTLVPLWKQISSALSANLLSDFDEREQGVEVRFNLSKVAALQSDLNGLWKRTTDAYKAGLLMKNEGRRALGYANDPGGDVYFSIPQKPAPAALGDSKPKQVLVLADGSTFVLDDLSRKTHRQALAALPQDATGDTVSDETAARDYALDTKAALATVEGNVATAVREYLRDEYELAADAIDDMAKGRSKKDTLGEDIVEQLGLDLGTKIQRIMRRFYPKAIQLAYGDAAAALDIDLAFDVANTNVQKVLRDLAKLVVRITETTREQIRTLVGQQAAEGWSIPRLAKELRALGAIESRKRALVIARTETASAYSRGSLLAYKASGVVESVEWVATLDKTTCAQCEALHGTKAKLGEAFSDGTMHPPRHPNCRCAVAPVVK